MPVLGLSCGSFGVWRSTLSVGGVLFAGTLYLGLTCGSLGLSSILMYGWYSTAVQYSWRFFFLPGGCCSPSPLINLSSPNKKKKWAAGFFLLLGGSVRSVRNERKSEKCLNEWKNETLLKKLYISYTTCTKLFSVKSVRSVRKSEKCLKRSSHETFLRKPYISYTTYTKLAGLVDPSLLLGVILGWWVGVSGYRNKK